jgi:polyvinyl alcohol dehydrogenase (cytochrome)
MKLSYLPLLVPLTLCAADDPYAEQLYQKHCASCHSAADAAARIPPLSALKAMTPVAILRAMDGIMRPQGAPMSGDERSRLANYIGTAVTAERRREDLANPCPANALWRDTPGWTNWGAGLANTRFQSAQDGGLQAADLPKLALRWVFAFPDTTILRSQPAVYRGRIFVGSQDGSVYALDTATGCVHWTTTVQAQVRSGMTVAEVNGTPRVFFGDAAGNFYALDGATGRQAWKIRLDEHPASAATGTATYYQGRLYVGIASREEAMSISPTYVCCTFRGSVSAIDAASGKVAWKRYMIADPPRPRARNKQGSATAGPSGAAVWTAPTLDPDRDTLYVTTGDNYSNPPTPMSDAVVALRMSSGAVLWSKQFTKGDAWNSSCYLPGRQNCPDSEGPDFDFAGSASLITLPNGKRALVVGQKSGIAYGIDPDRRGEILWQARLGEGGTVGGIQWGTATDGRNMYVALSDVRFEMELLPNSNDRRYQLDPNKGGGMFALRADNGERIWQTPPPGCGTRRPCSPAQSAAVTGIPGAVFSAAIDGHLRAYSTVDGKIIWDYDTAREFKSVNGVPARGGAIDVAGPVVAGGMLFALSGSAQRSAMPGNVLLAFGVDR